MKIKNYIFVSLTICNISFATNENSPQTSLHRPISPEQNTTRSHSPLCRAALQQEHRAPDNAPQSLFHRRITQQQFGPSEYLREVQDHLADPEIRRTKTAEEIRELYNAFQGDKNAFELWKIKQNSRN